MTWSTARAEMAAAQAAAFGEEADFTPASGAYTTRLDSAIFGEIQKDQEISPSFWGDLREVHLLASEVIDPAGDEVAPATGDSLVRYPDTLSPVDRRETWLVHLVDVPDDSRWRLTCVRAPRPVPGR